MTDSRDLILAVKANTGSFKSGMKGVRDDVKKTSGVMGSMTGVIKGVASSFGAMVAGAVSIRAAVAVLKESISLAQEQEKAEMSLAAALKATGGAAGYSLKQLKDYAAARQEVTTYGDEATIKMMSILATFGKVHGKVFLEATNLAQDLSAAFDQDLKSSAIQVGKALNDPITGLSALNRIGVSFTADQKEMVKSFMEVNDLAKAQGVIIEALKGNVGGFSEMLAKTSEGGVSQFKNELGDLGELIGDEFLPYLKLATDELTGRTKDIKGASGNFASLSAAIGSAADQIQRFLNMFDALAAIHFQMKQLEIGGKMAVTSPLAMLGNQEAIRQMKYMSREMAIEADAQRRAWEAFMAPQIPFSERAAQIKREMAAARDEITDMKANVEENKAIAEAAAQRKAVAQDRADSFAAQKAAMDAIELHNAHIRGQRDRMPRWETYEEGNARTWGGMSSREQAERDAERDRKLDKHAGLLERMDRTLAQIAQEKSMSIGVVRSFV